MRTIACWPSSNRSDRLHAGANEESPGFNLMPSAEMGCFVQQPGNVPGSFSPHDADMPPRSRHQLLTGLCAHRALAAARGVKKCNRDISPVDEGSRYNLPNVTNFSDWPEWLKVLVLVPHGLLASVACWLWWPKSEKGWRRFGLVVAYLTGVLCGHALRLSNERPQVVDAHGPLHSKPVPMRTMSEMAILQQL
jgi:hypothetical protein